MRGKVWEMPSCQTSVPVMESSMLSVRVILHSQSDEELKKGCVRQQICHVVCLKCE